MDNQQAYLGYPEMKEEGSSKLTCSLGLFGDEGRRDFFHVMHTPKLSFIALLDND
jgi:hypothetical protein